MLSKGEDRLGEGAENTGLDPSERIQFLYELGNQRFTLGDVDDAQKAFEQIYGIAQSGRDEHTYAVAKGQIADVLFQRGELDEALQLQTERLATNRVIDDPDGIAAALWDIAQIELTQGKLSEAAPRVVEAWQLLLQLGRADGIAVVGNLLGQLLAQADRKDDAREVLQRSADAYRKLGRAAEAEKVDELVARMSRYTQRHK